MRRAALVALLLAGGWRGGCGPGFTMPEPDSCDTPLTPRAPVSIEIGGEGGGTWSEGSVIPTVIGGQGSRMIVMRTYLSGADVPACARQVVDVTVDGGGGIRDTHDLPFRKVAGGQYGGGPVYLVPFGLRGGVEVILDVTVAGARLVRRGYIDHLPTASSSDAGPPPVDALL